MTTRYDAAALKKHWARLHKGDAEPFPKDEAVLAAWALFHAGQFQKAREAGLKLGDAGPGGGQQGAVHLRELPREPARRTKLAMFLEVAERAEAQAKANPKLANAHYWMAYALGRYSQGISVAKALTQGLGSKVKNRARDHDRAGAQARRCPYRPGRLPRRGDRQGRQAAGQDPGRRHRHRPEDVQGGAGPEPRLRDRPRRSTPTAW